MTTGTSFDATIASPGATTAPPQPNAPPILVCLPPVSADSLSRLFETAQSAFPDHNLVIAGAEAFAAETTIATRPYASPRSNLGWVLTATDYTAAATTLGDQAYSGVILIGSDIVANHPDLLRDFATQLHTGADLVLPRFTAGPRDGLVTAALLYPMSRALFGPEIRYPLPVVAALSTRMLQRLAPVALRTGGDGLLWPVAEAAAANFSARQVDTAMRLPPPPTADDFNKLLSGVVSSLFLEVEAKAAFWQRARLFIPDTNPLPPAVVPSDDSGASEEVADIVANFRLAYSNLLEIWALVLPPQTLVAVKRLSQSSPEDFVLQPELWARIVYDFTLAFHLRSLNRGHLLGAFTPLYLAWVASHVGIAGDNPDLAEQLVASTASAFEREKPYLVSRWRWPDRFNP
jgi:glucosylglycerate synthase